MESIDKLFSESPDKILYHYTSQRGVLGIIDSQEMWATNIFYLNDHSEYLYTMELVSSVLIDSLDQEPEYDACDILQENLESLKYLALRESFNEMSELLLLEKEEPDIRAAYVCSFTELDDKLSQWRGYSQNETGYSIGFDFSDKSYLTKFECRLGKCIYEKSEQSKIVKAIVDDFVNELDKYIKDDKCSVDEFNKISIRKSVRFYRNVFMVSPLMKSDAFEEENEWRLIVSFVGANEERKIYHSGKNTIIPRFRLSLETLPSIVEIKVGPTPRDNKLLCMSAVKALTQDKKMNVNIKTSELPYRGEL